VNKAFCLEFCLEKKKKEEDNNFFDGGTKNILIYKN
jgi:hypothetical protein